MSARSIRVSPAPDLPTWAHTPADYASPQRTDGMDEEIGANGSIAGLFVEDDEKVGLAIFYRVVAKSSENGRLDGQREPRMKIHRTLLCYLTNDAKSLFTE